MASVVIFGLGVLAGALGAFSAGRHFERAHQASILAADYVGAARELTNRALGRVLIFVVVVLVGVAALWLGGGS